MASEANTREMTEGKVYLDVELQCVKCGKYFTWTANDQKFFDRMVAEGKWQVSSTPKKCRPCKTAEKELKQKSPV